MEAQAYIRNVKITPKKLRFLLAGVKSLTPRQAMDRLFYLEKRSARILHKAIQSAVHNAKTTLKVNEEGLVFKTLAIEEGQKLKRYKAGGRGNVKPFSRKYAHIKVILQAKQVPALAKTSMKTESKKTEQVPALVGKTNMKKTPQKKVTNKTSK
ncbi:hypothetical protein A3G67_04965 [Candidatus Roizmanbacteria bacterium RIFCSPLOWO2_12_FULL_40_12]|uniref:50S ribosomal protein L22 n=1 Tax=Candidatus Roizmanbacteria bacterium RIFCSPLOWO2_01_FULL_40_42 TaxID=1802066 RepID=A0A1F7J4H1_9BACT|nr:MAG: hypothetical protein A2779_04185 [Candidatus Roizmanbacteria bacterium RIFCSPHIGHO2_01_FULL_40_98]OGK27275.1 MAG: hypothetical protein A3C31_04510 [Candidatus Roizmanbacteria bacterium RIFCSPHIGHO2_02_FULL_40_53]OGK30853.1 MAG: hypothetical protein A2W49_02530 [Candidatus Roizmanbacteria bacterium RIFCSPHIGHO2_12_41_18]OGK36380.1 MAG: hypothetical protein A3E69_02135 [Candidatus Roizmanbacteria bacterium RIFCSPHIGHO2_12_FULL_40_130]OGK50508.1 MAG: hypothetical protein A3B50_01865 [Candi